MRPNSGCQIAETAKFATGCRQWHSTVAQAERKNPPGVGGRVSAGGFLPLLVDCAAWVIRPAGEARAYRNNAEPTRWLRARQKPACASPAELCHWEGTSLRGTLRPDLGYR